MKIIYYKSIYYRFNCISLCVAGLVVLLFFFIDVSAELKRYDNFPVWPDSVITNVQNNKMQIALTLDACGSIYENSLNNGYDSDIIKFLIRENIPATIFVSVKWATHNKKHLIYLANNSLFEIENHGYYHRPCTLTESGIYNIRATKNKKEVIQEIYGASKEIRRMTGIKTRFYRPATGIIDNYCAKLAIEYDHKIIGWSINGDHGAKDNVKAVKNNLLKVNPGAIILLHMNHPEGNSYEGLVEAIPELLNKGFKFVKISDLYFGALIGTGVPHTSGPQRGSAQ